MEEKEQIKMFINNRAMSQSVYNVMLNTFLQVHENADIHVLAGQKIALELLIDTWKKMELLKNESGVEAPKKSQVGL